jgi:hypothetical protein
LIQRLLVFTFAATCALTSSVSASDDRTLASVAAADGFTYAWLPTESGVMLTRPGIRVVLRPGRLFYEVNNATPIADRAPTFNGSDLVISPALAARLHEIAAEHVYTFAAPAASQRVPGAPQPLTIAIRPVLGRLAITVTGSGTPNTSATITLTGEISSDLPIVTIRRSTVNLDASGKYSIEMGYGPDAHSGTKIIATVASATGADHAVTQLVVDGNTGVTATSLDAWPKN